MSTEPTDPNLLRSLLDWAWAGILGLSSLVWKAQNERMRTMEHRVDSIEENAAIFFSKLDEHSRRSEDRHHELMTALHRGLESKADK